MGPGIRLVVLSLQETIAQKCGLGVPCTWRGPNALPKYVQGDRQETDTPWEIGAISCYHHVKANFH